MPERSVNSTIPAWAQRSGRSVNALLHIVLSASLCYVLPTAAAEPDEIDSASTESLPPSPPPSLPPMEGRWEGILRGPLRDQAVSWHFEVDDDGWVKGLMGPTDEGFPSVVLNALTVSEDSVSFTIPEQNISFEGELRNGQVSGRWTQSTTVPLIMTRKVFSFELTEPAQENLEGRWQTRVAGTSVEVEFRRLPNNTIEGYLAIDSLNLRDIPIVDIQMFDRDHISFATDNGRQFNGRLINGILIGNYVVNSRSYQTIFEDPEDLVEERSFALDASQEARDFLPVTWRGRVGGTPVRFQFELLEDDQLKGDIFINSTRRSTPIIEAQFQNGSFAFSTLNHRYFAGQVEDGELMGAYSANGSTYDASFSRED